MTTIGINGGLWDAIFKSCVLVGRPERSVRLALSPSCASLIPFFEKLPCVGELFVDADAQFVDRCGDQGSWGLAPEVDTTYPAYPDRWIIDFIRGFCGLPEIPREQWFGIFSTALRRDTSKGSIVFLGKGAQRSAFMETLRRAFSVTLATWDEGRDLVQNAAVASGCQIRVVSFNLEAALFSAVGMDCIAETHQPEEWFANIFGCPGQSVVHAKDSLHLVSRLLRDRGFEPHVEALPKVMIGIPTIRCKDFLLSSVRSLAPQLLPGERILVVDNGRQGIRFDHPAAEVIETQSNLGVSGSWNLLLRTLFSKCGGVDWVLLLNDDVELGEDQLAGIRIELLEAEIEEKWLVPGPYQWSVFAVHRRCVETIGYFDENFFPAYCEDVDYERRILLRDRDRLKPAGAVMRPSVCRHSQSIARDPDLDNKGRCSTYYESKWGGAIGHERFTTPFGN